MRLSGNSHAGSTRAIASSLEVTADERRRRHRRPRPADPGRHRVCHCQRARFRRGATRHHPAARNRDDPRRKARPPCHSDCPRRRVRARRPLPAAVGAGDDDRARTRCRLRRGDRLPAAQRASGDGRRMPPVRGRPHLPHRRRAGDRGDGVRHGDGAGGGQDRRPRQRLRERGETSGVRPRRHRPACRTERDLRAGGRDR